MGNRDKIGKHDEWFTFDEQDKNRHNLESNKLFAIISNWVNIHLFKRLLYVSLSIEFLTVAANEKVLIFCAFKNRLWWNNLYELAWNVVVNNDPEADYHSRLAWDWVTCKSGGKAVPSTCHCRFVPFQMIRVSRVCFLATNIRRNSVVYFGCDCSNKLMHFSI